MGPPIGSPTGSRSLRGHEARVLSGSGLMPLFTGVRRREILGSSTSALQSSKKFALRVDLLQDHRLGRPRGGYGVSVPMHNLPLTIFFRSKDHRRAHS
jgi:hypothetical protein